MPAPATARETAAPLVRDERRLAAVRRILASGPRSEQLDRLTRLAADLLGTPRSQVSLLAEEQFVWSLHDGKAAHPDEARTTPLPASDSLCTVTAGLAGPLVVGDAPSDERVSTLPPVTSGQVAAYLGVPLVGEEGHVLGALCVYDDTPRTWPDTAVAVLNELARSVAAELELRALTVEAEAQAARLELALEAADIGSFDLDITTGHLVWDDRLIRLFGYEVEGFPGHLDAFNARVHPDDVERVGEAIEHAASTRGELSTEYRIVRPDGRTRWVEARGRVLGQPGAERLLGVAYDSTELREAGDRLSRLLESMTDAFYSLDREWRFTYVNRQAELLLGRRRDELLGASLWEEFPATVGSPFEEGYRGAVERDEPVAFEAPYDALGGVYELTAWPGPDGLSVYFREITERRTAEQERERAYGEREQAVVERERAYASAEAANQRLQLVADASARMAATLRPREVLDTLSELLVPALGQWVVVALTAETAERYRGREVSDDPDALDVVHVVHADPAEGDALRRAVSALPLSSRDAVGVGKVVRTRRPEWLAEVTEQDLQTFDVDEATLDALRAASPSSALSLPLLNRGRAIGAITVGDPNGDRVDRGLLEELAGRAAVALDNALLYQQQQRTARTLQSSLLPRDLPVAPGVATAARYLPGSTGASVGGDWYQGVRVGDRLVLAMGDVMGHGMRSAARMGQLRAIVATLALEGHGPRSLLQRLDRNSGALLDLDLATLLVAVLDPADGSLTVASAGHPPPLLAPPGVPPVYLDVDPGPPLGTLPGDYPETVVHLAAGTTLVLYTDGLVEEREESLDVGLERLRRALEGVREPPEVVADNVLAQMGRSEGADDDVALLVVSWDPASPLTG